MKAYFSVMENVRNRQTAPQALSSYQQVTNLLVTLQPTPSTGCKDFPYGPQAAISSIHRRSPVDSCHHHLDDAGPCQNDEPRCSGTKTSVNDEWCLRHHPMQFQQDPHLVAMEKELCSGNRDTEMNSTQLRRVPDVKNNDICCSRNENVSNRRTVPQALSTDPQVTDLPLSPRLTRSKTHFELPYGPQMAVSSSLPRSCEESYSGSLDDAGISWKEEKRRSVKKRL